MAIRNIGYTESLQVMLWIRYMGTETPHEIRRMGLATQIVRVQGWPLAFLGAFRNSAGLRQLIGQAVWTSLGVRAQNEAASNIEGAWL